MSSTTPRTRAWFAVDADWWPAIAEHLPHPWPEDAIRADLRWLRNEGRRVGLALPSRSALVARWGVTAWRARQLLAEHDPQQPEEAPPAGRQPAASPPPAGRQHSASQHAENADAGDVYCAQTASIPPAGRQHSASPPPAGRQATAENDVLVDALRPLTMNKEPQPQPQPSTELPTPSTPPQGGSVPGIHSKPNPSTPPREEDDLDWLDAIGASLDADREAASLAALEASAAALGARSTQAPLAAAPPAPPPAPPDPPRAPPAPPASAPATGPTVAETIARLEAAPPQQREQALGLELMAAVARRARAADAGPDWSTLPPLGERRPLPARPRFAAPPIEHDEAAQLWRAAADHRWRWPQASAAVLRLVDRAGLDALRVRLAWVAERHDALGVSPDWGRVMACA